MMVNRQAAQYTANAWRNGLDLEAALALFEPEFDAAELAEMANEQRPISKIAKRNLRNVGISELEPLLDAVDDVLARLSKATHSRQSRARQLIGALETGELLALGFPTDRPKVAVPVPVPSFLIQLPFANFGKSEFSDGEHRYSKVRVVEAGALRKPEIGRPSVRTSIFDLASTLARTGEITRDMPPKVQAGKIRKSGNFSEHVPSDQTIRRHLKSFWNSN